MSNTYRAVNPDGEAVFEAGVFEREFTVAEERDWLATGMIELVPRGYRALSDNLTHAGQGEEFTAAFLIEHEATLIQGGHIERVEPEPEPEPEPTPKKKTQARKKG